MKDIHGIPPNHKKYVVASFTEGNFWYWGSWDEEEKAIVAAEKVGGQVFAIDHKQEKEVG